MKLSRWMHLLVILHTLTVANIQLLLLQKVCTKSEAITSSNRETQLRKTRTFSLLGCNFAEAQYPPLTQKDGRLMWIFFSYVHRCRRRKPCITFHVEQIFAVTENNPACNVRFRFTFSLRSGPLMPGWWGGGGRGAGAWSHAVSRKNPKIICKIGSC